MHKNRSMPPGIIIPELVYAETEPTVTWLCQTFGFKERLRIGDHRAQLVLGEASLIVVARNHAHTTNDSQTHSVMVRVADVDTHYQHVKQCGAHILNPPETYPFGERQYSVEDPSGHHWTFTQAVADVAPET